MTNSTRQAEQLQTPLEALLQDAKLVRVKVGERLARPDEFPNHVYCLQSGELRVLTKSLEGKGPQTICRLEPGDWVGWASLLYGSPCEWISASKDCVVKAIPARKAVQSIRDNNSLFEEVIKLPLPAIGANSLRQWLKSWPEPAEKPDLLMRQLVAKAEIISLEKISLSRRFNSGLILTANQALGESGLIITPESELTVDNEFSIPPLGLHIPKEALSDKTQNKLTSSKIPGKRFLALDSLKTKQGPPDAYSLGLRDDKSVALKERYSERRGFGVLGEQLAVLEMLAKELQIPFRRDQVRKLLQKLESNNKQLSLGYLGQIVSSMGLMARPASVKPEQLAKTQPPLLLFDKDQLVLIHAIEGKKAIVGDGSRELYRKDLDQFDDQENSRIEFLMVTRPHAAAQDRFNWNWVWQIVRRYRGSLILVLVVSLVAQLFSLGVPLLLQQLIDKVLSQGNLSSLNALAGLMVAFALFQGLLTGLRSLLFVDTTDRIDLTLGSAVIDRLLQLPLGFFEKRPVGELSQRLGELNNIRKFLTGTAITTFLDLVFSSIYLIVMLSYSAGLTAIALSTFPIYLIITLVIAPLYKRLLRERAIAQARTQSHLIETLSGIQTVKAQHGELRARWTWQDRYQSYVEKGYRTVILGTTTGQIGNFLNTLSGLLILWAGLAMVLNGEFTLGQLLAFRIFAGYVTQPLLRLSNLWQGLQGVNLSMERLSDIVNQETEAGEYDSQQLALPPIKGEVLVQDLNFRFSKKGALQLDRINLKVNAGEFVGVVGLSGSGKSTLMKLIARLYKPLEGKILIDGSDINKVQLSSLRSQVGLVPQDSVLFEGSISDNIALNDPNVESEQIVNAAKRACAHDFIMDLPQGYATRVAEKGANFSGGQRQRLAIARMLLDKPSLLIMDEATSALDANTERKVCTNLSEDLAGSTVLFVTHRLATVMHADRIVVMDKGKVIENGSPQDLLKQNGIFASLWSQQS